MCVLVLGLAGIAQLNEQIAAVPGVLEEKMGPTSSWSMVERAEFEQNFLALNIGVLHALAPTYSVAHLLGLSILLNDTCWHTQGCECTTYASRSHESLQRQPSCLLRAS